MKRRALLALLLAACSGSGDPAAGAPSADDGPASPPADPVVETSAKETFTARKGLSTERIAALQPEPPAREGRTPIPLDKEDRYVQTASFLESFLQKRATDPNNPWAIGHGMLALGPELVLSNGRPAVDHLFETYAERFEVQGHGIELVEEPELLGAAAFAQEDASIMIHPEAAGRCVLRGRSYARARV